MKTVTEHLLALADAGNAAFTARLAPGVDPDRMLGCRIPQLRRLARTLRGTPEAAAFLTQLPHRYYDENNLHGILLGLVDAIEKTLQGQPERPLFLTGGDAPLLAGFLSLPNPRLIVPDLLLAGLYRYCSGGHRQG